MPERTIAENLSRLVTAKTNIANAITTMGGTVNTGDGFEDFPSDIATIPSGDDDLWKNVSTYQLWGSSQYVGVSDIGTTETVDKYLYPVNAYNSNETLAAPIWAPMFGEYVVFYLLSGHAILKNGSVQAGDRVWLQFGAFSTTPSYIVSYDHITQDLEPICASIPGFELLGNATVDDTAKILCDRYYRIIDGRYYIRIAIPCIALQSLSSGYSWSTRGVTIVFKRK